MSTDVAPVNNQPLVSVILPTLNSKGLIEACLDSLDGQSYTNIEIVGVDARSTDGTAEIMAERTAVHVFTIKPHMKWGTPYQDVFGAEQAQGKYLYFVDSDMVLPSDAIAAFVGQMEASKADALIVPEISFGVGFWAACKVLERSAYVLGDSSVEAPRFIRKSVWDESGGYDPVMGGLLDWDFHKRLRDLGKAIIRGDIAVLHNEGRLTLKRLARKKFTYGKSAGPYLTKHWRDREVAISQFNLLRPVYFRNWRALLKDPIHAVGFLLMKTVEGAAFAAGFASAHMGAITRRSN
jgi:glycosyltransferase involved in cell wall biosynthesis